MSKGRKVLSERRVVMAHNVARKWLFAHAQPEFRLRVFTGSGKTANPFRSDLHRLRNGDNKGFAGIDPIPDLGIRIEGDSFFVWSRNRQALIKLMKHYEGRGFETTGIW